MLSRIQMRTQAPILHKKSNILKILAYHQITYAHPPIKERMWRKTCAALSCQRLAPCLKRSCRSSGQMLRLPRIHPENLPRSGFQNGSLPHHHPVSVGEEECAYFTPDYTLNLYNSVRNLHKKTLMRRPDVVRNIFRKVIKCVLPTLYTSPIWAFLLDWKCGVTGT